MSNDKYVIAPVELLERITSNNFFGSSAIDELRTLLAAAPKAVCPDCFDITGCKSCAPKAETVQEPIGEVVSKTGDEEVVMSWWIRPALPVGTKLYAAPQPSDDVAKDAARYRWLCEYGYFRAMRIDMGGNHSWTGIGKGESIDAAIDAAMRSNGDGI